MENAMIKHVTPFAVILSLSSLVGFLAMLRAFFDGEVFDAGSMALVLICFWAIGLWILKRARISSPRDRIKLLCGTLLFAGMLTLYAWADAEELIEYQTFFESGSPEFEKGLQGVAGATVETDQVEQPSEHGVHVYPDADDTGGADHDIDHGVRAYPD